MQTFLLKTSKIIIEVFNFLTFCITFATSLCREGTITKGESPAACRPRYRSDTGRQPGSNDYPGYAGRLSQDAP